MSELLKEQLRLMERRGVPETDPRVAAIRRLLEGAAPVVRPPPQPKRHSLVPRRLTDKAKQEK